MDKKIAIVFFCLLFVSPVFAKDPTRPLTHTVVRNENSVSAPAKAEQPLTAIFIRNNKRFAVIEGKIYQAGEYYRDSRILNIYQDKVLLSASQGHFQLTLIPNIKK